MTDDVRARLRAAYAGTAADRNSRQRQSWKYELRHRFLERLQEVGAQTLLELGAGPGRDAAFFQKHGLGVVCVDLSDDMVALCRQKGLTAYVMDIADLQFPPASFDAIYALNCLLHIPKAELPTVLAGIERVLAPAGLFCMVVYGGFEYEGVWEEDGYEPKRFFSFYTDTHLRRIVSDTFDVVSFDQIGVDGEDELHVQSFILRPRVFRRTSYSPTACVSVR